MKEILNKALFELVKRVLQLSEEFDSEDYFNSREQYPDEKVNWIVNKLKG